MRPASGPRQTARPFLRAAAAVLLAAAAASSCRTTGGAVEPSLLNGSWVEGAIESEYPRRLRDAGIGGVVKVWLFVDEEGDVRNQIVRVSSGYEELDEVALKLARLMRFTPATNDGEPTPVWIEIPVTFSAR